MTESRCVPAAWQGQCKRHPGPQACRISIRPGGKDKGFYSILKAGQEPCWRAGQGLAFPRAALGEGTGGEVWNREKGLRGLGLAPVIRSLETSQSGRPGKEGQGEGQVAREPHPGGHRIDGVLRVVNTAAHGPAHEGTLGVSFPGGGEAFCGTFAATGSGVVFVMGKER